MKSPKELFRKISKKFEENELLHFLTRKAVKLGEAIAYSALLMFYAYKRKDTPSWARRIILGSFAYLLAPIDAVPDLTPFVGFTDDLGILSFGLVTIAAYINEEVREKAKNHLKRWFPNPDAEALRSIDEKL